MEGTTSSSPSWEHPSEDLGGAGLDHHSGHFDYLWLVTPASFPSRRESRNFEQFRLLDSRLRGNDVVFVAGTVTKALVEIAATEALFSTLLHPYTQALLAVIPTHRPRPEGAAEAAAPGRAPQPFRASDWMHLPSPVSPQGAALRRRTSATLRGRASTVGQVSFGGAEPYKSAVRE